MKSPPTKLSLENRFVVLLRGVNVGKGNRVPMANFKQSLETLGYTDITTLLNSGNALFSSPSRSVRKHATAISEMLTAEFHVTTPVVVKTANQFLAIVKNSPLDLPASEYSKYLVVFAQSESFLTELAKRLPQATSADQWTQAESAAYLYCPDGILKSPLAAAIVGKAGRNLTTRNWATVLKIQAAVNPS